MRRMQSDKLIRTDLYDLIVPYLEYNICIKVHANRLNKNQLLLILHDMHKNIFDFDDEFEMFLNRDVYICRTYDEYRDNSTYSILRTVDFNKLENQTVFDLKQIYKQIPIMAKSEIERQIKKLN